MLDWDDRDESLVSRRAQADLVERAADDFRQARKEGRVKVTPSIAHQLRDVKRDLEVHERRLKRAQVALGRWRERALRVEGDMVRFRARIRADRDLYMKGGSEVDRAVGAVLASLLDGEADRGN